MRRQPDRAAADGLDRSHAPGAMPRQLRDHGLTIVLLLAFAISLVGMALAGWRANNDQLAGHGAEAVAFAPYLLSGDFLSAVFENWESEFLQMSAYVALTAFLFQRGSAESRDPDGGDAGPPQGSHAAFGARRLGTLLYAYSLGLALAFLFAISFAGHLAGSLRAANAEAALHGTPQQGLAAYLIESRFWFESFQNWQSEFLSTAVLVVLSIFLRFHGSPESKRVGDPNAKTGK